MSGRSSLVVENGAVTDAFKVQVVASDPWKFVDAAGGNVLAGTVELVSMSQGLRGFPVGLRLAQPIRAKSAEGTAYFVAESSDPEAYNQLLKGESIECRLIGISDGQWTSDKPFDVTTWRGRYPAARVSLQLG
jgi:hypothetical protein